MKYLFTTLTTVILLSATAQATEITVTAENIAANAAVVGVTEAQIKGKLEQVLTDLRGLSVYTFDQDTQDISNCRSSCLIEWPPLHVPVGATVQAPFGSIDGNDGLKQLTLNGLPLYYYDDDKKVGDAFGNYPEWHSVLVTK